MQFEAVCNLLQEQGYPIDLCSAGMTSLSDDSLWIDVAAFSLICLPVSRMMDIPNTLGINIGDDPSHPTWRVGEFTCPVPGAAVEQFLASLANAAGVCGAAESHAFSPGVSPEERAHTLTGIVTALGSAETTAVSVTEDPSNNDGLSSNLTSNTNTNSNTNSNTNANDGGGSRNDADEAGLMFEKVSVWIDEIAENAGTVFSSAYKLPTSRVVGTEKSLKKTADSKSSSGEPPLVEELRGTLEMSRKDLEGALLALENARSQLPKGVHEITHDPSLAALSSDPLCSVGVESNKIAAEQGNDFESVVSRLASAMPMLTRSLARFNSIFDRDIASWTSYGGSGAGMHNNSMLGGDNNTNNSYSIMHQRKGQGAVYGAGPEASSLLPFAEEIAAMEKGIAEMRSVASEADRRVYHGKMVVPDSGRCTSEAVDSLEEVADELARSARRFKKKKGSSSSHQQHHPQHAN